MRNDHRQLDRREVLQSSGAALGSSLLRGEADAYPKASIRTHGLRI